MVSNPVIQINVRRSHLVLILIVVVAASASATVDIRDQMNVFGDLNMTQNKITNLQTPENPKDAATKQYADSSGQQLRITGTYTSRDEACEYYGVATASATAQCQEDGAFVIAQGKGVETFQSSADYIRTPSCSSQLSRVDATTKDARLDWDTRSSSSYTATGEADADSLNLVSVVAKVVCAKYE